MHDEADAEHSDDEAALVTHIVDEEAQRAVRVERGRLLAHLGLFHLVARSTG